MPKVFILWFEQWEVLRLILFEIKNCKQETDTVYFYFFKVLICVRVGLYDLILKKLAWRTINLEKRHS